MALSAQTDYIVPLISMMQLKSKINVTADNATCWKYVQWILYNK